MADRPVPRGRGAALRDLLKKHQESQQVGVPPDPPKDPPRSKGRAQILQKLQEMKAGGGDASGAGPFVKDEPKPRTAVEVVTKKTQELAIAAPNEPCHYRGENGRPLPASANYIRLNVEKDRGVFEYEVRFRPDVDAKSNRIKLLNTALGEMGTSRVYDGDFCLYLPFQWIDDKQEFPGIVPNTEQSVTTILVYKRKKRMAECLHLYNILFKRIMHILLYTRMGRNYFNPDHKHIVPQHKLEVFPGFAVAVDEMEDGLMVCLDTQHRVVRSQTAYELLYELRSSNPGQFKDFATRNIIGASVLTKYNNKTYIVDDIAWDMTPKDSFPTRDGGTSTFIKYYKEHHNITIEDIDQPMLINKRSKHIQGEKVEQMVCLIPELCYLTGLTDAMRSDYRVMKDVAAFTRITPNQRMLALRTYLERVRQSEKAQEVLAGWGLKIAENNLDVKARVLPQEVIHFGGVNCTFSQGTDWNSAATQNRLEGPVDMNVWQLYYTQRDERTATNFAETITRLGKGMGCIINQPQLVMLRDDRSDTYMNAIRDHYDKSVQFMVFICPTLRSDRYSIIKKMCCTQMPVASQVVLSKTLSNPSKMRTIIHKIAMQITCKLGGTLWSVKIPVSGWMVCGVDVYHSPGHQSVCGFVATINNSLTNYFSEAMFQDREIGDFFKVAFRKALQQYRIKTGSYPVKLIFFRDGVGDGQLDHCRVYELAQFEEVLREMNIEATITFVVIQKRINTRIFHMKSRTNAENPPPGTVVDQVVTRRALYDFYLIPQSVRQGTVNPTHYIVLHDSANIKPDHLQRLAYKLCHLYYNWSGTIRVPALCLYAHKLAGLVGQYIKKIPSPELSDRLYYL